MHDVQDSEGEDDYDNNLCVEVHLHVPEHRDGEEGIEPI